MMSVRKLSWRQIPAWALAAFFVVGSGINLAAPPATATDYLRWGYPAWFHFVTGGLELATAILLALSATRLVGATLGCMVMLAATATVAVHGEYAHAIPPIVVFALATTVGWTSLRIRSAT